MQGISPVFIKTLPLPATSQPSLSLSMLICKMVSGLDNRLRIAESPETGLPAPGEGRHRYVTPPRASQGEWQPELQPPSPCSPRQPDSCETLVLRKADPLPGAEASRRAQRPWGGRGPGPAREGLPQEGSRLDSRQAGTPQTSQRACGHQEGLSCSGSRGLGGSCLQGTQSLRRKGGWCVGLSSVPCAAAGQASFLLGPGVGLEGLSGTAIRTPRPSQPAQRAFSSEECSSR